MTRNDNQLIPIFRPSISDLEVEAVAAVLRSGWLGPGRKVKEFEAAFARAVGAPYAVSTANATTAIAATLRSLGVGAGDEVILPSFTYLSAFQVLTSLGATPVFADIEPEHLTLDPADVARRITSRTKGILSVHHGGHLAAVDTLCDLAEEHGLWLLDDAAHAMGASLRNHPVGTFGQATCFSFSAVKNMTTGDGGMVTTGNERLARDLARYRNLGLEADTWDRYGPGAAPNGNRWEYRVRGPGARIHMNDIAAALGLVQLGRVPELNRFRKLLVERYDRAFVGVRRLRSIKPRPGASPSWHMYTVLMDQRDRFVDQMKERGITIGVHYYPVHLYPMASAHRTSLPVTEEVWQRVTTFPLYPDMTEEEQQRVIESTLELAG